MQTRIVFLGTPDFALPSLRKLADSFSVVGVVTQPDRPAGRGRLSLPPPVKIAAQELGLPIFQPEDINGDPSREVIQEWSPGLICVAAFGQLLKPGILNIPSAGCLNVHASLLPRWRGASPINAAILAGDEKTGVTIMKMGPGLDSGPILAQRTVEIGPRETAGTLFDRLAPLGAELLVETIPGYLLGDLNPVPQDESQATYAGLLDKSSGRLDFSRSAEQLDRQVRAFSPWPGSFTTWKGSRLLIHKTRPADVTSPGQGVFLHYEDLPAVGTGGGILILEELQLAGKRKMSGRDFLNGTPDWGESEPDPKLE